MKKTLFFSNIVGDIFNNTLDVRFNNYMEEYLTKNIDNSYSMVFINAPGLGGEENYLSNVLKCFDKINIKFKSVFYVDLDTSKEELDNFTKENKKLLYFLMGGDPYSQMEIIEKLNIKDVLKNYDDLVIGFCAGALNLSKYSIITSDEDYEKPDSYMGINREDICIESHYNDPGDEKRNNELREFKKKYNTEIYCIPDESIIYFENEIKYEKGQIYII